MQQRELYGFGAFVLDAEEQILRGEHGVVGLPPKAIATLLALVGRRGAVMSKQELMDAVWPGVFVEEGNLTQNIFLLRRELGKTPEGEDYIQTLSKRGYRISVPVVLMEREVASPRVEADQPGRMQAVYLAEKCPSEVADATDRRRGKSRLAAGIAMVGVLIVLGLGWLWRKTTDRPSATGYVQITHDGAVKRGHLISEGGPDAALFTDGVRVYFTEGSTDAPALAEVSALGGDTAPIAPSFEEPQILDLSRSRSELLVSGGVNPSPYPALWAVPVPGGAARPLSGARARDGSWSPDGQKLAYLQGADLYMAKRDGTEAHKVAALPGPGWMPRWSPDGRLIRLTVFDLKLSVTALWEIAADGRGLRRLLTGWNTADGPMDVCCGSWTPDGEEFLFQTTRLGRSEIWAMPTKEGPLDALHRWFDHSADDPVQLTYGQLSSLAPVLSPDGRKLFVIGQQLRSEMERYDGRTREFVPYGASALSGISADFVDISPDGQWLAYVEFPGGSLWRCRMDGTELLQLTWPPMQVMVPLWSPDGSRIVFYGYNAGTQQQAYIVSANGGQAKPVQPSGGNQMTTNWSADGKSLMYSDFPFFVQDPSAIGVHVVDLETQKVGTLPGSKGLFVGTWSPDGTRAAAWGANGRDLMVFDFKSQVWAKVAEGGGFLKWSHDGTFVYFLKTGQEPSVMRVRVDTHKVEKVASLKGMRLAGRLAGIAFALTPAGDPLVLRDVGTQEIYSLDWHER